MGKLFVSFCVQRWGRGGGLFSSGARTSVFAGQSWTFRNYVVALAAGYFGAKALSKFGWGRAYAKDFWTGAFTAITSKLLWTEGFARSPLLQTAFGRYPNNVAVDPSGTTWIQRDGAWQSMMGGQLVDASSLDGQLVDASSLDGGNFGQLVEADYMDGRFRGYGHALPNATPEAEVRAAMYRGDGFTNPYQSSYASVVGAFSGAYSGAV